MTSSKFQKNVVFRTPLSKLRAFLGLFYGQVKFRAFLRPCVNLDPTPSEQASGRNLRTHIPYTCYQRPVNVLNILYMSFVKIPLILEFLTHQQAKVCQTLFWWMKDRPHSINILRYCYKCRTTTFNIPWCHHVSVISRC